MQRIITYFAILLSQFIWSQSGQAETLKVLYTHWNKSTQALLASFQSETTNMDVRWIDKHTLTRQLLDDGQAEWDPDVIIMPRDAASDYPKEHRVRVSSYKDLYPELIINESEPYHLPVFKGGHMILYYNKSLVDKPAHRMEDIVKLRETTPANIEVLGWPIFHVYWLIPFIHAYGEAPVVNGKANLNTKAVQSTISYVRLLVESDVLDYECQPNCVDERFKSGQSLYVLHGPWAYQNYKESLGSNLGIASLPTLDGKKMQSYHSLTVAVVPKKKNVTAQKQKLVGQYIRFLQSHEFQSKIYDSSREFPLLKKFVPSAESDQMAMVQAMDNSIQRPIIENNTMFWEGIIQGFVRYLGGALDEKEATALMQEVSQEARKGGLL